MSCILIILRSRGRTRRRNPSPSPTLQFHIGNLASIKCKVSLLGSAVRYFGTARYKHIIPIGGSVFEEEVPRSLLIPQKWATELVDTPMLPREFLKFVSDKTKKMVNGGIGGCQIPHDMGIISLRGYQ